MDRRTDMLYVTIVGSTPIDIKTSPAVVVKMGFPAIDVDDFFEENLVQNLAKLVKVLTSSIYLLRYLYVKKKVKQCLIPILKTPHL